MTTNVLEVNPERLWDSLERSAEIGRFRDVGLRRLALSAEDKQMRDLFVDWAKTAGCSVEIESISVSEPNLNGHLLGPDFFDSERHTQLSFRSTSVRVSDGALDIDGELTIKGVTKPVRITGSVTGPVAGLDGNSRIGLELATVIDRTAFGLDWNAPLPTGGFAVGDDVKLVAEIELVLEA